MTAFQRAVQCLALLLAVLLTVGIKIRGGIGAVHVNFKTPQKV